MFIIFWDLWSEAVHLDLSWLQGGPPLPGPGSWGRVEGNLGPFVYMVGGRGAGGIKTVFCGAKTEDV